MVPNRVLVPQFREKQDSTFKGVMVGRFRILILLTVVDGRRGGLVYKSENVDGC